MRALARALTLDADDQPVHTQQLPSNHVRRTVPSLGEATRFIRPQRDFDPITYSKFGHEATEMRLHGAEADVQLVSNLGVGAAAGHREQYLFLAGSQRVDRLRGGA